MASKYSMNDRPSWPRRAIVTAGEPYGNKGLHFGHVGGVFVPADFFARFLRDRLGRENVIFTSGTDCYGSPIMESYRKLKRITPYITAGLGATMWSVDGKTGAAFTIPFGVGVKYKPSRRLNIGLEFLMKKTFTDRLDGAMLDDPYGIKSSFMKNTDWYSTLTVTVTYEFSKRCEVCNYKD